MTMSFMKAGVAVFRTTSYGERLYSGPVRTFFRNEVRLNGAVYRVVEVTMRGRPGEEVVLCEYVTPTEYPGLMLAIRAAIDNRKEYFKTAAEIVNTSERVYLPGSNPAGAGVS